MSKIILGYPFSGALYGYIADEMWGGRSPHTSSINHHGYYKTLYGKNYKKFIDISLTFSILYEKVYLTPADNPWPDSPSLPDNRGKHPELGLYADWDSYGDLFNDTNGDVEKYLEDPIIINIFKNRFKIPKQAWSMILSSIIYEANLSREHRCPILCSPGRKLIIDRLIDINKPAIHPVTFSPTVTETLKTYSELSGLTLSPVSLENMMDVKNDKNVRWYLESFKNLIESRDNNSTKLNNLKMAYLLREAIERESLGNIVSGIMTKAASAIRIILPGIIPSGINAASTGIKWLSEDSRWWEFSTQIKRAKDKSDFIRTIDKCINENEQAN